MLFIALSSAGCGKLQQETDGHHTAEAGKPANLSITIASGDPSATKAGEPSSTLELISTLAAYIVDGSGNIVYYTNSETGATGITANSTVTINTAKDTARVFFSDIESGDYTIYYIANRPAALAAPLTSSGTFPYTDEVLSHLTGTDTPDFSDAATYPNGMPLTLKQSVSLTHGSNNLRAQLLRTAGRFSIAVYPHLTAANKICISGLSLSAINPSDTYLFIHDGTTPHSLPSANSYRYLPDLFSGTFFNPAVATRNDVFDTYLYEGHAVAYTLDISGAVFDGTANDVLSVTRAYTKGDKRNFIESTDSEYLIESVDTPYQYLYLNGEGTLAMGSLPSDYETNAASCANYRWKFSGTSSGTIRNVGTGKYIYYNGGTSLTSNASGANFSFPTSGTYFYMRSDYTTSYYYYFMNSSSPTETSSSYYDNASNYTNQQWHLYEYKYTPEYKDAGGNLLTPEREFSKTGIPVNYLLSSGESTALTNICRNEYVRNVVDIYYSPYTGVFKFEVKAWQTGGGSITFE